LGKAGSPPPLGGKRQGPPPLNWRHRRPAANEKVERFPISGKNGWWTRQTWGRTNAGTSNMVDELLAGVEASVAKTADPRSVGPIRRTRKKMELRKWTEQAERTGERTGPPPGNQR